MQVIPLQAIPSQTLTISLANQAVQIDLYQKSTGLFCNVWLNNSLLLAGVLCLNKVRVIRDQYFGFTGDLGFVDQQGESDPESSGLGTRWLLYYLEAADIENALNV